MTEYKAKFKDLLLTFDGKQTISFTIEGDARSLFNELKDKLLTLSIKEFRKKRSLDANAYFWVLCSKLAGKTGIEKTVIYRSYIKEIGDNSETVCIPNKSLKKIIKGWQHNGLGWLAETFPSKIENCTNATLYEGSSEYDTAQMSRLINAVVQDCKEQGIETKSDEEIQSLLKRWKSD